MKRLAILCNGPSLADHPLHKIDCETMGLNRSWELISSTHHVMLDPDQFGEYKRQTGKEPSTITNLWTGEDEPGKYRLRMMDTVEPRFSYEPLKHGVFLCGSVTWVALQIARYLDYTTIYMLGLDLKERVIRSREGHTTKAKFYGGQAPKRGWARQRELMGYAAGIFNYHGIKVYNINDSNGSECWAFPFMRFDVAFNQTGK